MANALTMKPSGGRKLPLPGKTLGTPGVLPAGAQDASCAHDEATMAQQRNPYTGKLPGPEWLRNRVKAQQQARYDALLAEMKG